MVRKIIGIGAIKEIPVDFLGTKTGYDEVNRDIDQLQRVIQIVKPKVKKTSKVVQDPVSKNMTMKLDEIKTKYSVKKL